MYNDFTDIPSDSWVNRHLPECSWPYARLMRLDRPIGTWLLLLPCWWGVVLASGRILDFWYMLLFAFGAVLMRGAGCVINDIYDLKFDRLVERTKTRPLACGELKIWQALTFLFVLLSLSSGILLLFNDFTKGLGIASLLLVFIYPLAKRVTWWPQFVLGLAFNWGALMGWSAVRGGLGLSAFILYAAGIFWTLAYDTIYAHQDKADDEVLGIKSLALKLGDRSKLFVGLFYAVVFILLAFLSILFPLGKLYFILLIMAGLYAAWLVLTWDPDRPESCLICFRLNRNFGFIVLIALFVGKLF